MSIGGELDKKRYSGNLPNQNGFVWVVLDNREKQLAYFTDGQFQTAETAGDQEGLSVEYYENVIGWADIQQPQTDNIQWI